MPTDNKKSEKLDVVTIKYGGSNLTLTKSDNLIAVKPQPNRKKKITQTGLNSKEALKGYDIYSVTNGNSKNAERTEETLDKIRASADVSVGSHVYHTSDDNVPFIPTGEIFIKFKDNAPSKKCQALIEKHNLMLYETRDENEYVFKTTSLSENPLKVTASLQQANDLVEIAEPSLVTSGKLHGIILPDDTLIKDQWHLKNTGFHRNTNLSLKKGADARVIDAWEKGATLGSSSVVVAVIDDGFDLEHPDLYGTNKIHTPWDFTRNNNTPVPGESTQDWHGTACAGVAVGNTNSKGIVGAAPNCKLMPIRWGTGLEDKDIEYWFKYVADNGAWVVSCSWGADATRFVLSYRMKKAISECAKKGRSGKGIIICFAAANSNTDINAYETYNGFATHPDVIAVAACTSLDTKSHYSCFGKSIFICAPSSGSGGMGILTADVRGNLGYGPGDFTYDFGGTSSATPLVAGICALILSVKPSLTSAEVKDLIKSTARKIGKPAEYTANGHSSLYGYGCIDAVSAIKKLVGKSRRSKR